MAFSSCKRVKQSNAWDRHSWDQTEQMLMKTLLLARNALNFSISCSPGCCLSQCRWVLSCDSICGMVMAFHKLNHSKLRSKVKLIALISSDLKDIEN